MVIGGSRRTLVWDDLNPQQRLSVYDRGVDLAQQSVDAADEPRGAPRSPTGSATPGRPALPEREASARWSRSSPRRSASGGPAHRRRRRACGCCRCSKRPRRSLAHRWRARRPPDPNTNEREAVAMSSSRTEPPSWSPAAPARSARRIVDQLLDRGRRPRSTCSTTSCAAAGPTSTTRSRPAGSTLVEGDIRDRDLVARPDPGHGPRLPPGGDPDHPVRRGAAAGARGAGRRHLQRGRGGRRSTASTSSSPRRRPRSTAWPRSSRPPSATTPTTTTRSTARRSRSTRACCAASARCTASTTCAALLQRLRPADGRPRRSTPRCWSAGWSASPTASRR